MINNLDRLLKKFERKAEERANKLFRKLLAGRENIIFLISPMHYCNLNCIYCSSYGYKTKINPKKNLRPSKVYKLVDMIIDFKKRNPLARVSITFHGYEPVQYFLLFPEIAETIDKKIYEAQLHALNPPELGTPVFLNIQTNGTLLSERLAKWFAERAWTVSVSIDGPKEVHDYNRPFRTGKPSYNRVMQGIKNYEKHKGEKPFIISVWTKKHLEIGPEGYYNWLKENRFWGADIHYPALFPGNPNIYKFNASLDIVIKWFLELYEIWANDNSGIVLYPFVSYIEALIKGRATGRACYLMNGCHRIVEMSHDGRFRHCDRWVYTTDVTIDSMEKLEDVLYTNVIKKKLFMRPQVLKHFHPACSKCKWFPICQGGCPSEAKYNSVVYKDHLFGELTWNKTYYCEFHKALFERIAKDLKAKKVELGIKV